MIQRKSLIWFLVITCGFSWVLFLVPLAFQSDITAYASAARSFWALAMWGPGLAAILVTLLVEKQHFRTLRLGKLGPARFYLIAYFLPLLMILLTVALTAIIRTGQLDTSFSLFNAMLAQMSRQPVVLLLLIFGPFVNILFALGEELGWRGFLLPRLLPVGQWRAILISGVIWGLWHAPVILQGYNYPQHPVWGVLLMTVSTVLLGAVFSWLYLETRSPWAPALAHGSLNAFAGLPYLFLLAGFDTALGGIILSITGWIVMLATVGILAWTKQLPVKLPEEQPAPLPSAPLTVE